MQRDRVIDGYINTELLATIILLFIVVGLFSNSLKDKKLLLGIVVFLVPLLISISLYSSHNNFEHFKNGGKLICKSTHRDGEDIYLISKEEGWTRFDSYFKKDSLLIKTYQCEER